MVEPVTLKVNGSSTWLNDSNTKLITLYCPSTTVKSMHNCEDNTDYKIPTGKKFIILHMMWTHTSDTQLYLDFNTTADTDAGGTQIYSSTINEVGLEDHTFIEISAGNYLNHENGLAL